jgi:cytidylate kinase
LGIVVAIDGPAGAGKSTVAKLLAKELGWRYLDTGALYRAVALVALQQGVSLDDAAAIGSLADSLDLRQDASGRTWVGDRNVSSDIRTEAVSQAASRVSALPPVRQALVDAQRRVADDGDLICEGRDMGTVIFPDAILKVFLDADLPTRASRRLGDLADSVEAPALDSVRASLEERDRRDTTRAVAPLRRQADQVHLDTSDMTIPQVLEHLRSLVAARCGRGEMPAPGS